MGNETTLDGLLNHRIVLEQPKKGYRIAVDTLLLAASIEAKCGEKALDVGCGVGGSMLALSCRIPGIEVTGIEIRPEIASLCFSNIKRNGMEKRCRIINEDFTYYSCTTSEKFDQIMMNPPYHDENKHKISPYVNKRYANSQKAEDLKDWLNGAENLLNNGGTLTIIHRSEMKEEILRLLPESFREILVKPIVTKPQFPPRRVIIRAKKGHMKREIIYCSPFTLHEDNGKYTKEAEDILRNSKELMILNEK